MLTIEERETLERWARRPTTDPLVERNEGDAERPELLEQHGLVTQVTSEPIEAPDDEHVESAPARVSEQPIELGTSVLRVRGTAVDVLNVSDENGYWLVLDSAGLVQLGCPGSTNHFPRLPPCRDQERKCERWSIGRPRACSGLI